MKNIFKAALLIFVCAGLWSCYDDYVDDFAYSTSQFISQRPVRTVVAQKDHGDHIYVGVDIGGKREVDVNDWATFVIDPTLLDGVAGKTLMPENYYQLGDPDKMRVRKPNLPVADVEITFTQAFYDDPLSMANTYVIPFKITESSCDQIPEGKDYSLVCVKYVSPFCGTYYIRGKKTAVDAAGTELPDGAVLPPYYIEDISKNPTRVLTTLGVAQVRRGGVADLAGTAKYRAMFTMTPAADADHDFDVAVTTGDGGTAVAVTNGTGKFFDAPFDTYETKDQARFEVSYIYQDGANFFKVEEELIRRRDPYMDLRFEEWQ
jgi:hypothetical protein